MKINERHTCLTEISSSNRLIISPDHQNKKKTEKTFGSALHLMNHRSFSLANDQLHQSDIRGFFASKEKEMKIDEKNNFHSDEKTWQIWDFSSNRSKLREKNISNFDESIKNDPGMLYSEELH